LFWKLPSPDTVTLGRSSRGGISPVSTMVQLSVQPNHPWITKPFVAVPEARSPRSSSRMCQTSEAGDVYT
jgi:hypothetical protein